MALVPPLVTMHRLTSKFDAIMSAATCRQHCIGSSSLRYPTDFYTDTCRSLQSSSLFLERAPRSAPVSDQTNHWYALALRPRCAGIHGVRFHPLLKT